MEVEEAISCLSRFEQTSEKKQRERGGRVSSSTQVQSYQVQRETERRLADWLSRVKVIDNIECVWPWLVT